MYKYDLSVIVPSIRVANLEKLLFSLEKSVEPYSPEMIVVGPYSPPASLLEKENVRWIKDLGSPSRCVQIGSMLAEGKYFSWMADDGLFQPLALGQCISMFETKLNSKGVPMDYRDAICLTYFEGEGNGTFAEDYWTARTHADQRLLGIDESFKIAPLAMYRTAHFRWLGGLDCRYLHINMCNHDLAFRLQNCGGRVHLSPSIVARFYWSWIGADAGPVQQAYFTNDRDLFTAEWNQDRSDHIKIDLYNWQQQPRKWKMRFPD